jgi:hypothetical protein
MTDTERVGYVPVHNRNASDGLWKIGGRRQAVYGRAMVVSREADNKRGSFFALGKARATH